MAYNQAFGNAGAVYRKDRSNGGPWSGQGKRGGGSGPSSAEQSRSSTPVYGSRTAGSKMTSDLLHKPTQSSGKSSNASGTPPLQPKASKAVRKLTALIESLQDMSNPSAPNPCFCLARTHALSSYTPLCMHCGLILCTLHPPAARCPSCEAPLLTPSQRQDLFTKLDREMSDVLNQEDEERRRKEGEEMARLLAESGGGLFPSLEHVHRETVLKPQPPQERKVLTLGGKKGPTLTTTRKVKVPPAAPQTPPEPPDPAQIPIPPPPTSIKTPSSKALNQLQDSPFLNLFLDVNDRPIYIPEVIFVEESGEEKKRRRRNRKRKEDGTKLSTTAEATVGPSNA